MAETRTETTGRTHVRWLIRRDMQEVLAIESASFGESSWKEDDFLRCLRQRECIGMIAEFCRPGGDEPIQGYMIFELHKGKLHILNFAVAPRFRRLGVGTALVANLAAALFYKACHFEAIKVLRGHCEDSGEDAYLMRYSLGD